jgi:muramoyltetrapeptide carboxypeptidase
MKAFSYATWQPLKPGSMVHVIAPSGGCELIALEQIKDLLHSWELVPQIANDTLGSDLLCANSDEKRFGHLREALLNPDSQAIWCLRGGYGCTRLIPELLKLKSPKVNKLFIGFSDITSLHIFLQQKWHWQTLHGPSANQVVNRRIDDASIQELKKIIFGQLQQIEFSLTPLNAKAEHGNTIIESCLTGGTLTLVQASLGTDWHIETKDKILFLEEVNESAYRIDRMLQHLQQSAIFHEIKAILLGDFISNDAELIQSVLKRFAQERNLPVFYCPGIGHGKTNRSLPLGAKTELNLSKKQLTIKITG